MPAINKAEKMNPAMGTADWFRGKSVLVTGACGTIGSELIRTLLGLPIARLCALDNNETEIFFLEDRYRADGRFEALIGDIRDYDKLQHAAAGIDVVFHGAALKHVIICERSPFDAVQTNVIGIKNVINAALACDVGRVIFMSSDKAVNPTNVMGTSKLMGERLITAANSLGNGHRTVFSSSRFGNVLGSRGSVLPVFVDQVRTGKAITLTDTAMTRFVMSPLQAVQLVMEAAMLAHGGEVFVTKMPVMRIADLARVVIEQTAPEVGRRPEDVPIKIIGAKPGEKLYEELLSEDEMRRAVEIARHFVVLPAFRSVYAHIDYTYAGEERRDVSRPYRSDREEAMSLSAIREFLATNGILIGRA